MPSLSYTPAQHKYTGGEFALEPIYFTYAPGSMIYAGSAFDLEAQYELGSVQGETFRLNRLQKGQPLFDKTGAPLPLMIQNWQTHCERIEAQFSLQGDQITDLQAIVSLIQAAQKAAVDAQQAVQAVAQRIDLANSYTDPTSVLTATSDGTITIAPHERVYDNGERVAVNGGSLSGYSSGQFVRVFYEDAARAGGAVAYQGSTIDVAQQGNTHVVGAVTIPAMGETPNDGQGTLPPGYIIDARDIILPF